jgi:hypothetical protein
MCTDTVYRRITEQQAILAMLHSDAKRTQNKLASAL